MDAIMRPMKARQPIAKSTKTSATRQASPGAKVATSKRRAGKRTAAAAPRGKAGPAARKQAQKPIAKSAKTSPKSATRPMVKRRDDYGAPIDGFFAKQPPATRTILETLRTMIAKAIPDAIAALKWGMPMYTIGGAFVCGLGGHKAHVNLILAGPPGTFADPEKRLTGEGKTGRRLTLRTLEDLPRGSVQKWLRAAAGVARVKA
jgi:hypothetical protein